MIDMLKFNLGFEQPAPIYTTLLELLTTNYGCRYIIALSLLNFFGYFPEICLVL